MDFIRYTGRWLGAAVGMLLASIGLHAAAVDQAQERPAPQPHAVQEAPSERFRIDHNPETFTTHITIRSAGGEISAADVAKAIARAKGYDDAALDGLPLEKALYITRKSYRMFFAGLNLLMGPGLRFAIKDAEAGKKQSDPELEITLDRRALLSSRRALQARFRKACDCTLGSLLGRKSYGIDPDEGWKDRPVERNLWVLLHGLDSTPEKIAPVLISVREAGFPCATFRYPNDQPIAESARLLAKELERLREEQPRRGITLLTSSMGGLVARAAVEDPKLDPGNVKQMILVATPNHGSALARFEFGLELYEHLVDRESRGKVRAFFESVEDGLGEAGKDLCPDSVFLTELNSRARNPAVCYSLILGSGGFFSEAELESARRVMKEMGEHNRFTRFYGKKVQEYLADLDEVLRGKGDGAVSLARGRLEGVEDTVVLDFSHLQVFAGSDEAPVQKLRELFLERLRGVPKP